jgi:hypothetical protein
MTDRRRGGFVVDDEIDRIVGPAKDEDGLGDWILGHPVVACLVGLVVKMVGDWLGSR